MDYWAVRDKFAAVFVEVGIELAEGFAFVLEGFG